MMTDTCGPTWQMPFAYYDPDTSSVRTSQATFPWDSTPSSPTLPPWGSMRGGELYERPTPAPLTAARDCSLLLGTQAGQLEGQVTHLLLPTPVADHSRVLPQPGTDYQSLPNVAVSLLPTPTASRLESNRWGPANTGPAAKPLGQVMVEMADVPLLPTPAVNDMGRGKTPEQWDEWTAKMQASHANGNGHGKSLDIEAQRLLLPTPTAAAQSGNCRAQGQYHAGDLLHQMTCDCLAPTLPPSPDGNKSSDDQPLLPLNLDGTTDPD